MNPRHLDFKSGYGAPGCRFLRRALLGLLLIPAAPQPAETQDVDPGSWKGNVDFGFDTSGGNQSLTILRGGFGLTYLRTNRAEFDATGSLRYGESQGQVIERQLRGNIKLDLIPQADWTPFVYVSLFRDPIRRRLDLRTEAGLGGKRTLGRWTGGKASLSGAGVLTMERFTETGDQDPVEDRREARISWRSKLAHAFDRGGTSVEQIAFYQPVWNEWGDYLFVAQSSLKTRIVGSLSIVLRHEYLHDQTPVEGVVRDDWTFAISFRYDF